MTYRQRRKAYRHRLRKEILLLTIMLLRFGLQGLCFAMDFIELQPLSLPNPEAISIEIDINQSPLK